MSDKNQEQFAPLRDPSHPPTWDEKLIQALRPWGRELGGAFLFMVSILTLFGLLDWIDTSLVNLISNLVLIFTGWLSYPLTVLGAAVGLALALRQVDLQLRFVIRPKQWLGGFVLLVMLMPIINSKGLVPVCLSRC